MKPSASGHGGLQGRFRVLKGARIRILTTTAVAALALVGFSTPPRSLFTSPAPASTDIVGVPRLELLAHAFGRSGAVQIHFALPGDEIDPPFVVSGDSVPLGYTSGDSVPLRYIWLRVVDSAVVDAARGLEAARLVVPTEPGFYRLALVRSGELRMVDGLTVAVMVPLEAKRGPVLEGYRIGIFTFERRGGDAERPAGLVRVTEREADLSVSKHFRLADFLSRDDQKQWPRYTAVSSRVLDKVELVVSEITSLRSRRYAVQGADSGKMRLSVQSAFRTPLHNRGVRRAAPDSRHQYGDAMDVAIDADGDGRLTTRDTRIVASAVDAVESRYPDLAGGMGLYTSRRYVHPYVHIDARGRKVRWRG